MARTSHGRHVEDRGSGEPVHLAALALVCCLPVLVIAIVLLSAGGTRAGLLVPALGAGGMIGILMFTGFTDHSGR